MKGKLKASNLTPKNSNNNKEGNSQRKSTFSYSFNDFDEENNDNTLLSYDTKDIIETEENDNLKLLMDFVSHRPERKRKLSKTLPYERSRSGSFSSSPNQLKSSNSIYINSFQQVNTIANPLSSRGQSQNHVYPMDSGNQVVLSPSMTKRSFSRYNLNELRIEYLKRQQEQGSQESSLPKKNSITSIDLSARSKSSLDHSYKNLSDRMLSSAGANASLSNDLVFGSERKYSNQSISNPNILSDESMQNIPSSHSFQSLTKQNQINKSELRLHNSLSDMDVDNSEDNDTEDPLLDPSNFQPLYTNEWMDDWNTRLEVKNASPRKKKESLNESLIGLMPSISPKKELKNREMQQTFRKSTSPTKISNTAINSPRKDISNLMNIKEWRDFTNSKLSKDKKILSPIKKSLKFPSLSSSFSETVNNNSQDSSNPKRKIPPVLDTLIEKDSQYSLSENTTPSDFTNKREAYTQSPISRSPSKSQDRIKDSSSSLKDESSKDISKEKIDENEQETNYENIINQNDIKNQIKILEKKYNLEKYKNILRDGIISYKGNGILEQITKLQNKHKKLKYQPPYVSRYEWKTRLHSEYAQFHLFERSIPLHFPKKENWQMVYNKAKENDVSVFSFLFLSPKIPCSAISLLAHISKIVEYNQFVGYLDPTTQLSRTTYLNQNGTLKKNTIPPHSQFLIRFLKACQDKQATLIMNNMPFTEVSDILEKDVGEKTINYRIDNENNINVFAWLHTKAQYKLYVLVSETLTLYLPCFFNEQGIGRFDFKFSWVLTNNYQLNQGFGRITGEVSLLGRGSQSVGVEQDLNNISIIESKEKQKEALSYFKI